MLLAIGRSLTVAAVLLLHQVLIKHLLVPDFVVHYVIVKLKFNAVQLYLLSIFVVVEPVDLLVNHFHDLVFV